MSRAPGEVAAAIKAGYRVTVHQTHFPYADPRGGEMIHAEVDHAALAIFCSQEWAKAQGLSVSGLNDDLKKKAGS